MGNDGRIFGLTDTTPVHVWITGRFNALSIEWGEARRKFVQPFGELAEASCAELLAHGKECRMTLEAENPLTVTIARRDI